VLARFHHKRIIVIAEALIISSLQLVGLKCNMRIPQLYWIFVASYLFSIHNAHKHKHCTTSCPQTCAAALFSVVAEIDQRSLAIVHAENKTFTHSTELIAFSDEHQPHFSCSRNPPLQKQFC